MEVGSLKYLLAEIYSDVAKCQRKTYGFAVRESHFNTKKIKSAEINDILLNLIEGENIDYRSVDSVLEIDNAVLNTLLQVFQLIDLF